MKNNNALDDPDGSVITTERVARVVSGIATVGHAHAMLEQAGWETSLAANNLTVDHSVVAQFVSGTDGAHWSVHNLSGAPPVWVVGASADSYWGGCVE